MSSLAVPSKPRLSGPDKAAAFLLLAGKEAATRLADYFSEEELRAVFVAAERLKSLTVEEMEALVEEFHGEFARNGMIKTAGSVESLFSDMRPGEDFSEFVSGTAKKDVKPAAPSEPPTWSQIAGLGSELVVDFLREEHPQTSAYLLSRIDQTFAARVLDELPDELCNAIVLRLVDIEPVDHPILAEVDRLILQSFTDKQDDEVDGEAMERVAGVVNELSVERVGKILDLLKGTNEAKAEMIRKFLFRFEGVETLERQDRAILFDGWAAEDIARALFGASDSLKESVLDVLSQRNRRSVENEMSEANFSEDVIQETRRKIAKQAVMLSREGRIRLTAPD